MSKILITIEDDFEAGGVKYTSNCDDMTLKEGKPSPAMIVAVFALESIQKQFESLPETND